MGAGGLQQAGLAASDAENASSRIGEGDRGGATDPGSRTGDNVEN